MHISSLLLITFLNLWYLFVLLPALEFVISVYESCFINIIDYILLWVCFLLISCFLFLEAKQIHGSGESCPTSAPNALKQSTTQLHQGLLLPLQGPTAVVREGRSLSASTVLQPRSVPTKVVSKKSPKLWHRRNAHVTPLNGPAPSYGEWPLVGFNPLEEFSKLHEYYGQEVKKAREEWLKSRQTEEQHGDGDLIDLGWNETV